MDFTKKKNSQHPDLVGGKDKCVCFTIIRNTYIRNNYYYKILETCSL